MDLNKIMILGCLCIYAFPQNAGADKIAIGACLSAKDTAMTKEVTSNGHTLTHTIQRAFKFKQAQIIGADAPGVVFCRYSDFTIQFQVPNTYAYKTCSFKKDSMEPDCKKENGNECIVYCELSK